MTVDVAVLQRIVDRHRERPGATLPILHEIQEHFGYIPTESVAMIADGLNWSRAEVHGVISFYADFRTTPPGRNTIQICRGEACQARGSGQLELHAKNRLGIDYHETTSDRCISLEPVYCLGNCGCSPSIRVGREIEGRVDDKRFDEIVAELRSGETA